MAITVARNTLAQEQSLGVSVVAWSTSLMRDRESDKEYKLVKKIKKLVLLPIIMHAGHAH